MATTHFFWDPIEDNIVQERDETGDLVAEYTTEPGLYGNAISQNRGGVESQFHHDAQGSMLAVTGHLQEVTDSRAYSAFGDRFYVSTGRPRLSATTCGRSLDFARL